MGRTFIIAEAGVNHNGSLDLALRLVDAAASAGVDAVKFQTFRADRLVTRTVPTAAYQQQSGSAGRTQFELLHRLELSEAEHRVIAARCRERNVQFLSTPFDEQSLDFLAGKLKVPALKISSGDLTNAPLLLRAAMTGLPIYLSTGMSTLGEIEQALMVLAFGYLHGRTALPTASALRQAYASEEGQSLLRERVVLLHCTTEYPCPYDEVNLRAMRTLNETFGLPVGISDHTEGIVVPIAAVAMGASVIEKHFTLDRNLPGPDHRASIEPEELVQMVRTIRQTEQALGRGLKFPTPSEAKNREVVRKGLVTTRPVRRGERFTTDNLAIKRGGGAEPILYWDFLGRVAERDYEADEPVTS
ncbi:sialic acid synthase [Alicyclobacillus cellulosilyticus]|uniref:Sialic acid synthase n=2 Tax=Alicyclobacillus cellulosilyticus TaxID=1003997 RepID=A0A917KEI8_9BACL|nr:sialic acid synthase [Alicyclobacillus cellulosilyticus]